MVLGVDGHDVTICSACVRLAGAQWKAKESHEEDKFKTHIRDRSGKTRVTRPGPLSSGANFEPKAFIHKGPSPALPPGIAVRKNQAVSYSGHSSQSHRDFNYVKSPPSFAMPGTESKVPAMLASAMESFPQVL